MHSGIYAPIPQVSFDFALHTSGHASVRAGPPIGEVGAVTFAILYPPTQAHHLPRRQKERDVSKEKDEHKIL